MAAHVLVVEDSAEQREMIRRGLSQYGYKVSGAEDADQALEMAKGEVPEIFLIDLELSGRNGFSLCADLNGDPRLSHIPRLIISADCTIDTQVRGLREYVDDYLTKPFDFKILVARMEALLRRSGSRSSQSITEYSIGDYSGKTTRAGSEGIEEELIGSSLKMRETISTLRKFSYSLAPVLVMGESGTGKEFAARTIHTNSVRKSGPFVSINCAAIPEDFIEAELFGYERGAFTGAIVRKRGKVEMAHGGTLFLDEVGELTPSCQVKLLRFLEDFIVERVGGTHPIRVDVRVVASSNRNLQEEITAGRFREDLFYRLAILSVRMPPLRERGEDKVRIAEKVFQTYSKDSDRNLKGFSLEALSAIREYHWPGNVRQLINSIRRAIVTAENNWISQKDIGIEHIDNQFVRGVGASSLREVRGRVERDLIENVLSQYRGNISRTARELGVSRPTLYTLIKKHNLQT